MKFSFFTVITLFSITSFAQNVGIGETSPANKFTVKGNLSVGASYSTTAAPTNGAIIQGNVGIGTPSPAYTLDANGIINAATGFKVAGGTPSGSTYLKGNGTNFVAGTIQAADVPTLNQNTTGSAASFTGSLSGDVTGTQGATVVGKINGTSLAGLATGILKNTTGTGVPSIAVAADFPSLSGLYVDLTTAQTAAGAKTWSGNAVFNGTIGMGTTTPAGTLGFPSGGQSIAWGTGPFSKIYDGGNIHYWTDDATNFESGATGTSATWSWIAGQSNVGAGGTTWMTLNNGNLGIGAASPGNRLEITSAAAGASGLRFTNLNANTAVSPIYSRGGKYLTLNSSGDVVLSNPIIPESRYTVFARWFTNNNGYGTFAAAFNSTDDYGLPFPGTGVVTGTPYPYPYGSGSQPSSYYVNPWSNWIDDNAYMQHSGTNFILIYDFYMVFPTTGTYNFSFPGTVDDASALYTTPLNDLNPADMVQRSVVTQYQSGSATYSVTATANDAVRARVYYAQGGGGHSLTLNVAGATTNLMSMVYSIK